MRLFPIMCLLLALTACATTPDMPNQPLAAGRTNAPPASPVDADPDAPLIFIAFSGGGSRAAALGLGVLDELAAARYSAAAAPARLIDQVKIVSSVSGGSVVAAWFGLVGPDRVDELVDRFLVQDNMATLVWQAADPLTWARLAFSDYTRIDVLSELLDRRLFQGARFGALRRPGGPFIVMNASDMISGEVFAFTPERFDDICSDLDALPITVGVAASAAFPVALTPITLRNHRYESCPATIPAPGWIAANLTRPLPRYLNLEEYKRARYANALRNGPDAFRDEHYPHLLDGGLADNQGVQSLTDVLISPHGGAGILAAINDGKARRIVVLTVNARSDADNGLGRQAAVPGLLDTINAVIDTPIDATTAHVNAGLQDLLTTLKSAGATAPTAPGQPLFAGLRVYGVAVDFDQFAPDQRALRDEMKSIGTSWTVPAAQIHDAIGAGRLLLRQHPCYQRLLLDLKAAPPGADEDAIRRNCPFEGDGL
jgi:NTE family protein